MNSFAWGMALWCLPGLLPVPTTARDVERFPDAWHCERQRELMIEFKHWLERQRKNPDNWTGERAEALEYRIRWAVEAAEAWENLRSAHTGHYDGPAKVYHLNRTRAYLGEERWTAGIPPPTVPTWWLMP